MRNKAILFFTLIITTFLITCNPAKEIPKGAKAKNIILLIGDGMGLSQVSSAYYFSKSTPNFSRFKYIGLHHYSYKKYWVNSYFNGTYNSIFVDKCTLPDALFHACQPNKHFIYTLLYENKCSHIRHISIDILNIELVKSIAHIFKR